MIWSGIAVYHRNMLSAQSASLWNFMPFFVSTGFLIVGLATMISKFHFFIISFFFAVANTINVGFISADYDLSGRLFYILLAWLPIFLILFHIFWLGTPVGKNIRRVLLLLSTYNVLLSIPFFFLQITQLQDLKWFPLLRMIVRLDIAFTLIFVLILLAIQYLRKTSLAARSKIRLVLLGSVLGITPLILFSILPDLLGIQKIPFEASFPWLLFIPLFYGYSIYRNRLANSETWIVRLVLLYLFSVLFFSGYWIIVEVLSRLIPEWKESWAIASSIVMGVLFLSFSPFRSLIYQYVEWSFYGKELSIQTISEIANLLLFVKDRDQLYTILVDELPNRLNWSGSALFLKNNDESIPLEKINGLNAFTEKTDDLAFDKDSPILEELSQHTDVIENSFLKKQLLTRMVLSNKEKRLLELGEGGIWILLVTPNGIQGVLLLGSKQENFFTAADRRVLKILSLQASVAIHQIQILEEVRAGREEIDRTHQQMLVAREEERYHIARELHDSVIQQLIGIGFLVQQVQKRSRNSSSYLDQIPDDLQNVRKEIGEAITKIRSIIYDIRPAGLEVFGFAKALEDYLLKLQQESPEIKFSFEIDENEPVMPDQWKINLFRITQEAIRNSIRHASPSQIGIGITYNNDETILDIWDNGCGFQVPTRISEFAQKSHFGLIGLSERVKVLGGDVMINSSMGEGTKINVRIPFGPTVERMTK
jgi:signal transduction histidine kinase